jgi:hypothetical protein
MCFTRFTTPLRVMVTRVARRSLAAALPPFDFVAVAIWLSHLAWCEGV